jgi:3-isopropylmalate/(R)-2-methylmalate dehydratase small subunit
VALPTQFSGEVLKLGDDINTDVIYPGKYILFYEPEEMKKHVLEGLGEEYSRRLRPGSILVAGENFGCGSSREQAAGAIQAAGVSVVVAKSFARIFFRNAINFGLFVLTCPEAVEAVSDGDRIQVDIHGGRISFESGESFQFPPLPDFLMEIVEAGGLVAHGKKIIAARKAARGGKTR